MEPHGRIGTVTSPATAPILGRGARRRHAPAHGLPGGGGRVGVRPPLPRGRPPPRRRGARRLARAGRPERGARAAGGVDGLRADRADVEAGAAWPWTYGREPGRRGGVGEANVAVRPVRRIDINRSVDARLSRVAARILAARPMRQRRVVGDPRAMTLIVTAEPIKTAR